jgi:O-antigen biosynthesis protein
MPPEVSVVIPWCGEPTLYECLARLGHGDNFEVVVVDNRRSPSPVEIEGLVREEEQGAAAARNRGIRQSCSEYVFFIDADCLPEEGWVSQMLMQLKATGADGTQGPVLSRQQEPVARYIQAEFEERQGRLQRHQCISLVSTGNAAFRRSALESVGCFDPKMRLVEDTDLSFRLTQKGYTLRYVERPVVWHAHPTRMKDLFRRKFRYGYWVGRVYLRHPRRILENTRTPRQQLASIGLWLAWGPAAILFGWPGFATIPLLTLLPACSLVATAGAIAFILNPLCTLMNAAGLVAGMLMSAK